MKIKAKIFQIVKWEEKEKYFFNTDFGDEEIDLFNVAPIDEDYLRWYERTWIGQVYRVFFKSKEPRFKYKNMTFGSPIIYEDKNLWDKNNHNSEGLVVFSKRPHNFKEGDMIEIEYNLNPQKTEEVNENDTKEDVPQKSISETVNEEEVNSLSSSTDSDKTEDSL